MIGHMRHGSPPRLLALQSILSPNRRESLPTPSAGVGSTPEIGMLRRLSWRPHQRKQHDRSRQARDRALRRELIPTRTERHALAQSRKPMGMTPLLALF